MAFDFPNSPSVGQRVTGVGGIVYVWDGVKWASNIGSVTAQSMGDVGRNLLHNPLFNVAQRGVGPFSTNAVYTADRWMMSFVNGSMQTNVYAQVIGGAVAGDEQSAYVLGFTITGTAGAGDFAQFVQRIESVSRLSGKTVTVSFYANASAALKVGINLTQVFGTGGSPSTAVGVAGQSVTLAAGGVWARYSLTFNIPSIVGKTLGTTLGTDFTQMAVWLSSGATNNTNAGGIGVQSGSFNFWGVQLEIGSVATPLEKPDPRYDLANCQRFYQTYASIQVYQYGIAGAGVSAGFALPVAMRAVPSAVFSVPNNVNTAGPAVLVNTLAYFGWQWVITAAGSSSAGFTVTLSADL